MEDPAAGRASPETVTASSTAGTPPGHASHATDGDDLAPGARVDRYEVIELLGQGSMGRVYRARDTDLSREVALKRINPGRWSVEAAQVRLHREAQAMARVEHPAVIRAYDITIVRDELFVAMELARGGTLVAWLAARPRGWRDVLRVFLEAGRGLAAAHHAGLVHRDVKPSNLLLDAHGRAKVSDFGLARTFDIADAGDARDGEAELGSIATLDVSITRTGAIAGTLAYMAPEQLTGGPVDARAVQFSFCVALWEALCGHRPFRTIERDTRSPEAFLAAIAAGALEGPGAGARVPRRILAPLRRGLAGDRAQRWPAMDELLDALERAARPHRAWWVVAAAVVIGAGVALVVDATRSPVRPAAVTVPPVPACGLRDQVAAVWNPAARARYLAGTIGPTASEDAGWFDWYARALEVEYAAACGRAAPLQLACLDDAVADLRAAVVRPERNYWPRLRALDRCGIVLHERELGGLSNGERALLSSDGRQVVVLDVTRRPVIRDLGSGGSRPLELAEPLRSLPDGSIVGWDDRGQLVVVDPVANRTIRTVVAPPVAGGVADVSSDLRTLAVTVDGKLSIVPAAGGASLVEPIALPPPSQVLGEFSPDDQRVATLQTATLHIDDLGSHHREILAIRAHVRGTGLVEGRWIDPTSFVFTGSATSGIAGDLWRVRVDRTGHLDGPPQIVLRAERDTSLALLDVQAGKLLVQRVRANTEHIAIDGDMATPMSGSTSRLRPVAVDRAGRRILAAIDPAGTHAAWMSLDGSSVTPILGLDGLSGAVVSGSGFAALDRRTEPPAYVALDEAGVEVARIPLDAARGASPALRCGAIRCVVLWIAGGVAFTAAIDGHTLAAPIRRDQPGFGIAPWELSPDGLRISSGMFPYSNKLTLHDVDHATARTVTSQLLHKVQHAWFLPDGALLVSGVSTRFSPSFQFALCRRDAAGRERMLWHGDSWIAGAVPLDDRRLVMFTISYQIRLALLEAQ